ncbi:MAG: TrmB family transcriptional regulator sugar-binding domain-containing protein [Desulfurococcaceae archaeon]
MSGEELITKLSLLGFTNYEARVYIALLKHGSLTSTEIIKVAKIPQARLYDVMEKLVSKGLVKYSKTRPVRYSLVDPSLALRKLIDLEIAEKSKVVEELLKNIPRESIKMPDQSYVWMVSGLNGVMATVEDFINKTRDELLVATYSNLVENFVDKFKLLKDMNISTCIILYDKYEHIIENFVYFDEVRYKPTYGPIIILSDLNKGVLIPRMFKENPLAYIIEDPEILTPISGYYFYLRDTSNRLLYRLGVDVKRRSFRNLIRAIEMINELQARGYKVLIEVEGVWVSSRKRDVIKGKPIDVVRDKLREITTLIIEGEGGSRISIGGLGATFEDFEAHRITVSSI